MLSEFGRPIIFVLAVLVCVSATNARDGASTPMPATATGWPTTWAATKLRDHPLVGRIYSPSSRSFVSPKDYLDALTGPRFVLLGEVHDNPDHHTLQAVAVRHMRGGDRLTVVFEHFRSDQQALIDAVLASEQWMKSAAGDDQIERLFLVTQWRESGWPPADMFRPLVEAAFARHAKIIAGNLPRRRVMQVAREGLDALSADARRRLVLDIPLGDGLDDALLSELEESHCGLMPKAAFTNMAVAQRLRDGNMARVMVDATRLRGPVALVAGNGHVRLDRAVPWYITRMVATPAERPMLAIAHVEVADGKSAPGDYTGLDAFSLVIFTPRAERPDPCERMRARFGRK